MVLTEMVTYPSYKRQPLILKIPISPGLDGPYLVTSSRDFLWVERAMPGPEIRAAPRKIPLGFLFRDALYQIRAKSLELEWGNVLPPTAEGLQSALNFLEEYELPGDRHLLHGSRFPMEGIPLSVSAREEAWVPAGWAVLLPEDRGYLGTTIDFAGGVKAAAFHNPSRGIVILAPEEDPDPEPVDEKPDVA
jgi:hypothetical protein